MGFLPAFRKHPVTFSARSVVWLLRCLARRAATIEIEPYGYKLYLPAKLKHHGTVYILRRGYEPALEHIGKLLGPNDVFIDGGATIGIYTCAAAKVVGPFGVVLAFEPSEYSFPLLERNVDLNGFQNVHLVEAAISDRIGRSKLYHIDNAPVRFSLGEDTESSFSEIDVQTVDAAVKKFDLKKVDFVKLDIEGAEKLALMGARETIRNFHPKILLEVNRNHMHRLGVSTDEVREILDGYGYGFYMWGQDGRLVRSTWPEHAANLLAVQRKDTTFELKY